MPTMKWCELGTSMAMSPVPAASPSCCSGNEVCFIFFGGGGRCQEPIKTTSFLAATHSCPAEANTAVGWGRFPGTTYVVQVGEFDFQRGEERPREWLHSHRDDFGVQNGAVPGEERGKRAFRGIFVEQGILGQPSLGVQGLEYTAQKGVDPIIIKYSQRHLLLMHPLGSPHSQSTSKIKPFYEPYQPLKQLALESVSFPEIKYSWAHFLSLP